MARNKCIASGSAPACAPTHPLVDVTVVWSGSLGSLPFLTLLYRRGELSPNQCPLYACCWERLLHFTIFVYRNSWKIAVIVRNAVFLSDAMYVDASRNGEVVLING